MQKDGRRELLLRSIMQQMRVVFLRYIMPYVASFGRTIYIYIAKTRQSAVLLRYIYRPLVIPYIAQ